jgi:chromosome segregation ATPase
MARDLDLNITGNARRAQQALNDVATGTERAARITDQLSRSFDNLEDEANEAQRALDRVNDEIANNGPTAELNAELAQLQRRLSEISDERRLGENLRAQFRRSTAAAQ